MSSGDTILVKRVYGIYRSHGSADQEEVALDECDSWSDLSCESCESVEGQEGELSGTSLEVQNVSLSHLNKWRNL